MDLVAELEKAIDTVSHVREWYAVRFKRLEDLGKEKGCWPEMAAIFANGGLLTDPPPSYALQLNLAVARAEAAEAALAGKKHIGWGDYE